MRFSQRKKWPASFDEAMAMLDEFGLPRPQEIAVDDTDGCAADLTSFGEAGMICRQYSRVFGGCGGLFDWYRGDAFLRKRELLGKSFRGWYSRMGFDRSDVSRCEMLRKGCADPILLFGLSARAARKKFAPPKRQYTKRQSPAPKSSDGQAFLPDYNHDVRRNPSSFLADLVKRCEAYNAERPGKRIASVLNNLRAEMENMR
jgi:hypothetical protein